VLHRDRAVPGGVEAAGQRPFHANAAVWVSGVEAGRPVVREATHEATLEIVPFELLLQYAVIPETLH
jgi:uncharacterized protein (DUF2237 family)